MRIFKLSVALIAMLLVAASQNIAPNKAYAAEDNDISFASPLAAYHQGMGAYRAGRIDLALPALQFAARRGVLGAMLHLARIYENGLKSSAGKTQFVAKDDAKAFEYYRLIASRFGQIGAHHPAAKYVSAAYIALANYYQAGIPALKLGADPKRAADLYRYASSYFGDAQAQYHLAQIYLNGSGVQKNPTLAVNWFYNAAKKQHALAQAKLGEILWQGEHVKRNASKALAFIQLAQNNANEHNKEAIGKIYQKVFADASQPQKESAIAFAAKLDAQYGGKKPSNLAARKGAPFSAASSTPGFRKIGADANGR